MTGTARRLGRKAETSDLLDHAVRIGLVSYGVQHLLIAWLAVDLALGDRSGSVPTPARSASSPRRARAG